jgi:primosomal protein N' (replication factor Y)
MQVYTVIPITKGIGKETLSYFGPDSIDLGSLVNIPLRSKTRNAIVVEKRDIGTEKANIKSSTFALRKIGKVVAESLLSSGFMEAARLTATFSACTTGAILAHVVPKLVLEYPSKKPSPKRLKEGVRREPLVLQADDQDRIAHYKSFIRGEFARNASVFFCVPTIEDIRFIKDEIGKGISDYTAIFHSGLSKKEFQRELDKVLDKSHPVLILGTPAFLSIERDDVGSIILDRENSRSYRVQTRPYFDLRVFVKHFATCSSRKLIFGDMMLSVEALYKLKNDEYSELSPIKSRLLSSAENLLVDMKGEKNKIIKDFRVLSLELEALIDKTKEESEQLFIFSGRKGLAPVTVCGDCGQVVTCRVCSAPVVLYSSKSRNFFKCNKCGEERDSMERCTNCDSWKLTTLGIGIELVESEIKKKFPNIKILRIDKETIKTEKKAQEIVKKFEDSPGSILLGTEMALVYLKHSVENVAVASIDSLLSIPDFRINEKIFYTLLTLRGRARKVFVVQTRNASNTIFDYALKGNITDFYREEVDDRKKFSYPPFSIFIKLSIEGRDSTARMEAERIATIFEEESPIVFESRALSKRGGSVVNILIRLPASSWPNLDIIKKIESLPLSVAIRVDPETLL